MTAQHRTILALLVGVGCFTAIISGAGLQRLVETAVAQEADAVNVDTSVELFKPIISVIRHPRCMNCHTVTDFPRQNDDRRRHLFGIVRGMDNHGAPGMVCSACHGERNADLGGVPGAPHWGLAPLSMGWEYMTDTAICAQLKDSDRNGGKDLAALHVHMVEDPLVLWAWTPGLHPDGTKRSTPPLDLPAWEAAMERWMDAGAPCPLEGDRP